MPRRYNTLTKGRDSMKHIKQHEQIKPGTVLWLVRIDNDEVWHTSAVSALKMWELHQEVASLWQRYEGVLSRLR